MTARLLRQELMMRRRHVGAKHVTFEAVDGQRIVAVTADDYLDMGSPETVTVRIEPGDRLNA